MFVFDLVSISEKQVFQLWVTNLAILRTDVTDIPNGLIAIRLTIKDRFYCATGINNLSK